MNWDDFPPVALVVVTTRKKPKPRKFGFARGIKKKRKKR